MDCSNCANWNNGRGKRECLKCKKYLDIQRKSIRRESIKADHIPDAILENIADPRTRTLLDIIQQLPIIYAVPLMMRVVLRMSYQEIADYHHEQFSPMYRRMSHAIEIIKKSLADG